LNHHKAIILSIKKESNYLSKTIHALLIFVLIAGSVFPALQSSKAIAAEGETDASIDVTTIEEDGDAVQGSPLITAVPPENKPVEKITFLAKAVNEPEESFYGYAAISKAPYSWSWATGDPWVPDGEYSLRMDIEYESGEEETITRNVIVANYDAPTAPPSPKSLLVSSRTDDMVELTWEPSSSDKTFNYEIYQDDLKVAETTGTTYTIGELSPDTLYTFRVKTKDIYNNLSTDNNTIKVLTAGEETTETLPLISEIKAPEPNGVTPRNEGYSGTIELSVDVLDPSVDIISFAVKTDVAPESDYWEFPDIKQDGDTYTVAYDTTSAPDGNVIIKTTGEDKNGQMTTVTKKLLIDNEIEGYQPPTWEDADTPPENYVIAYLAGWSTLSAYDLKYDLDVSRLSHINYSFGLISNDLDIKLENPGNDLDNFAELAILKEEYPHLKTTIAIGGWGGSANFSEAAVTEESRETFANNAVNFIVEHGFNGIDLDWEYPVTGGGPGTYPNPDDEDNFPLLLETLRQKLDEQGEKDGTHYSLSIAGAANTGYIKNTQIGTSHQYLDYVQVMTYDIHGSWEELADLNAPLYDDDGKTWSVDKAIQAYIDAGVPNEKLVMGVPFYGYTYDVTSDENNGLRQKYEGSGSVTYNRIMQNDYLNNGYTRIWDEGTQTPYLFNEELSRFITYDDVESITKKAEYIREQQLGGAMIWEISQDHGNDLLDALYTVLKDPIDHSDAPTPGDGSDDTDEESGNDGSDGDTGNNADDSDTDTNDDTSDNDDSTDDKGNKDDNGKGSHDDNTGSINDDTNDDSDKDNNHSISDKHKDSDDVKIGHNDESSKKLPNTASSMYNWMILGFFTLLVGIVMAFWKYKRVRKN
jgi:chitinase